MSHLGTQRAPILAAMERGVDVLVIGGGGTGAGVALDAATRGYAVGLVERSDYASGTSSRSTKLIHGGLRYLPQRQFDLVREAATERDRLRRLAPHLVTPLAFLVPLYIGMRRPLGVKIPEPFLRFTPLITRTGLLLYDLLAMTDLRHATVTPGALRAEMPNLRTDGLVAAYRYYDAQTDDVRLTHAVLQAAKTAGARALNYAEVTAIDPGPPAVVTVRDRLAGGEVRITARHVINAAGIWAENVARLAGDASFQIRRSKGVHLVLDLPLEGSSALVIPETDDGRLAFLVPWRGRWILGTTDDPYDGDPDVLDVTPAETRYLLDHLNRYLSTPVGPDAIIGAYAGLRPLVARSRARPANLSRSHEVIDHANGVISIIGGKLTTYRKMAEDTVDAVVRRDGGRMRCRTARMMLDPGANPARVMSAARVAGLEDNVATHLCAAYGSGTERILELIRDAPGLNRRLVPDLPMIAAEVIHACREEQAASLSDWMVIRSRLTVLDRRHGTECADEVAELMARALGWTEQEKTAQLRDFAGGIAETAFIRRPLPSGSAQ